MRGPWKREEEGFGPTTDLLRDDSAQLVAQLHVCVYRRRQERVEFFDGFGNRFSGGLLRRQRGGGNGRGIGGRHDGLAEGERGNILGELRGGSDVFETRCGGLEARMLGQCR